MSDHKYVVVFRTEPEGGHTALVPALPGCVTYGVNLEHAKLMAADAIRCFVLGSLDLGEEVPSQEDVLAFPVEELLGDLHVCEVTSAPLDEDEPVPDPGWDGMLPGATVESIGRAAGISPDEMLRLIEEVRAEEDE